MCNARVVAGGLTAQLSNVTVGSYYIIAEYALN
jgi:hypothetical protein